MDQDNDGDELEPQRGAATAAMASATGLQEPLLPTHMSSSSPPSQQPQSQQLPSPPKRSRNIPVMLWYQAVRCGTERIWTGSVLAAYVYMLRPHYPEIIGYLSAVEGIVQFVAACVTGILADYQHCHDRDNNHQSNIIIPWIRRREVLLRISSVLGAVASILVVTSCHMNDTTLALVFLAIALALNGAFDGMALTVSLALFADSILDGERSYYFTQRTLCTTWGQMAGPVVALLMFYYGLGDAWTVSACDVVMQTAQVLLFPAFALLWCFRDPKHDELRDDITSGRGSNVDVEEDDRDNHIDNNNDDSDEAIQDSLLRPENANNYGNASATENDSTRDSTQREYHRSVAALAAFSDVVCAIASGLSLRYFTIFFLDNLLLGPVIVNLLDTLACVIGSILLVGAQRASVRLGRCTVSIFFKVLGALFLAGMIGVYWWDTRQKRTMSTTMFEKAEWEGNRLAPPSASTKCMVCFLYLLQMAFLNSTGALTRSLVMDNVPSHERAKWSALESINIFLVGVAVLPLVGCWCHGLVVSCPSLVFLQDFRLWGLYRSLAL